MLIIIVDCACTLEFSFSLCILELLEIFKIVNSMVGFLKIPKFDPKNLKNVSRFQISTHGSKVAKI
jgi:hypothetical protein